MSDARELSASIRDVVFSEGYDASPVGGTAHEATFVIRPTEEESFIVSVTRLDEETFEMGDELSGRGA